VSRGKILIPYAFCIIKKRGRTREGGAPLFLFAIKLAEKVVKELSGKRG